VTLNNHRRWRRRIKARKAGTQQEFVVDAVRRNSRHVGYGDLDGANDSSNVIKTERKE